MDHSYIKRKFIGKDRAIFNHIWFYKTKLKNKKTGHNNRYHMVTETIMVIYSL